MSGAARSLFAFGVYVALAGVLFLIAPQLVVTLLHLPAVSDGWMRVIGLLALVIGAYDMVGATGEFPRTLRASVFARFGFAAGIGYLVAAGQMPPALLLFGFIDAAGALWTALALRSRKTV